jgi:nicotinamide mononucleotide transporter
MFGNPVEVVAVTFTLACVVLTIRKHIACWPLGIVGVLAYGVLFYQLRLYADMALQVVFLIQSVYGWHFWLRGGANQAPAPVRRWGFRRMALVLAMLALGAAIVGTGLAIYTDASVPHLDAFLALTSLTATALLARKILENWLLWILADLLYVGLFVYKGVYLSAALYAIFLVLATAGLFAWMRDERREGRSLRVRPRAVIA